MKTLSVLLVILTLALAVPVLAQSPIPTPTIPPCAIGESGPDCAPYRPPLSPIATPTPAPVAPISPQEQPAATQAAALPTPSPVILLPQTGDDLPILCCLLALTGVSVSILAWLYKHNEGGDHANRT